MESPDPSSSPMVDPAALAKVHESAAMPAGRKNPWLVFLLPFLVFMLVGSFEPAKRRDGQSGSGSWIDLGIDYSHYPLIYTAKIVLTIAAMIYVMPGYRQIPCRTVPALQPGGNADGGNKSSTDESARRSTAGNQFAMAALIGIVGAVAWIALAYGQHDLLRRLGWSLPFGERSAFNPLVEIENRAWACGFLAIRFFGLVAIVPIIEEFFLRGFLMRFLMADNWWAIPIGTVNRLAVIAATLYPMLTHPGELVAAALWFSAVTWLLVRTRNLWACVAAHATTNLLMGVFVLATSPDNWWLM